ncbi:MAG: tetratricopeptide repeat protein [Bryobacter sp.]|nr:tetratricopeptide repeat protein [Bryobacter sp.]
MKFRLALAVTCFTALSTAQQFTPTSNYNVPSAPSPVLNPPPTNPQPLTPEMRGDIYMARKMYREAIEMYKQMPQNDALTWNKLGIAYHQLGQLGAAKKHYEKAAKLNKQYAEAWNNLGTIAYAQKSYRRATSRYKKALSLNPASASMHSNLGTAYFARKKYELAAQSYQKALELDPNVFENRGSYGTTLQERSVEERAKFHFELARLYAKNGRDSLAFQYLRKSLEEGYKAKDRILSDSAFAAYLENPEFQTILNTEYRVL